MLETPWLPDGALAKPQEHRAASQTAPSASAAPRAQRLLQMRAQSKRAPADAARTPPAQSDARNVPLPLQKTIVPNVPAAADSGGLQRSGRLEDPGACPTYVLLRRKSPASPPCNGKKKYQGLTILPAAPDTHPAHLRRQLQSFPLQERQELMHMRRQKRHQTTPGHSEAACQTASSALAPVRALTDLFQHRAHGAQGTRAKTPVCVPHPPVSRQ